MNAWSGVHERFPASLADPGEPAHPLLHGFLTRIACPRRRCAALARVLWNAIASKSRSSSGPRTLIRLSTHFYNTEAEIERLPAR